MRQRIGISSISIIGGLFALLMVTATACGNPGTETSTVESTVTTVSHELRSDKERARPADVDDEHLADLVGGNSNFAFDLYQNLRGADGNLFYSPYSISLALAMTYAGARGETERQMADTLHYLLTQDKLHPAFNALDMELASRGEGAQGKDDEGFSWSRCPGPSAPPLHPAG